VRWWRVWILGKRSNGGVGCGLIRRVDLATQSTLQINGTDVIWCFPPLVSQLLQIQPSDNAELIAIKQYASRELSWAHLKIQALEERLRKQRIDKYGPASESLTNQQLQLLESEPGVSAEEVVAEAGRDSQVLEVEARRSKRERRPHPGRQELPEGLPRVERLVALPESQCTCGACGKGLAVIGYESSEQLDVEPAKYIVRVTKREKRACGHCGEAGLKTTPAPARIVEKSLVSDRVIVDTVIAKYCDHTPLYRQSAMLERDTGVEIHRATMDGWVMQVGELLQPVANVMLRNLVSGSYLQADETPVDVKVRNGAGKNHQAYLWQYSRPGGEAVFEFRMGRGREGPEKVLKKFEGILQTDGYQVYNKVGGEKLVQAACWAHYLESAVIQRDHTLFVGEAAGRAFPSSGTPDNFTGSEGRRAA
jgi:transposase